VWRRWSGDWRVQRVESSAGLETGGRSERSRLLVLRLVGVAESLVCSSQDWGGIAGKARMPVVRRVGVATGSCLLVMGLVGVANGVVRCPWTGGRNECDWWEQREESRRPVMGLVDAASGVVCWSRDWWAQ